MSRLPTRRPRRATRRIAAPGPDAVLRPWSAAGEDHAWTPRIAWTTLRLLLLGFNQLLEAVVEDSPRGPLAGIDRVVPEPRLQPAPALELEELQARWQLALESYGWVDREAGIARIPIERAMTILAERGGPNPVEGPPAVEAPPAAGASDDSRGAR